MLHVFRVSLPKINLHYSTLVLVLVGGRALLSTMLEKLVQARLHLEGCMREVLHRHHQPNV